MFYIIESDENLETLQSLCEKGAVYVDVIGTNDNYHPILNNTVAVFIRVIEYEDSYIIPIAHSEGLNVDKDRVYTILSKATTLYTLNKKDLLYHFNLQRAIDVSLLVSMNLYEKPPERSNNQTIDWYYNEYGELPYINTFLPLSKLYERCESTFRGLEEYLKLEIPSGFDYYNKLATNIFYFIEREGLKVDKPVFVEKFTPKSLDYNYYNGKIYTYYNLYNITSRPTNAFNSVNFAAIPKEGGYREAILPTNDMFIEMDFDGYHIRLIADQLQYPLTDEKAHQQLAKEYFGDRELTEEEYLEAKKINFHALYGSIPVRYKDVRFFKEVSEYIEVMWKAFNEDGVINDPISGKPFTKEYLPEMNPKKLMNYLVQSLETSNNIAILYKVLKFLSGKKTSVVLYTYDAILFNYNEDDGKELIPHLQEIMQNNQKFPIHIKTSTNLVL